MKASLYLPLVLHLLILENIESSEDDPIVHTKLGKVRGYSMTSRSGRQFLAFSGLPYAQPPVGQLRFKPPEPVDPWTGVKDALENGPYCIQWDTFRMDPFIEGVEDCLYLSIYSHNISGKAPVLVHIHGGGFMTGNGAKTIGPQYLMDEDVVIVDVNYRLNIFGFLSFEDVDMPGNQGLKDQLLALHWIQENIASFGGDPNSVTLVGESAGGSSVYYHTVSPLSRGLFHRAIAESGTSYNWFAINAPGSQRNLSLHFLSMIGCKYTTTNEAVACLRNKDANEVISKIENLRVWQVERSEEFGPVLEPPSSEAFLVGPISEWNHSSVPLLMGTTSAEGLVRTLYFEKYNMSYEWYSENFDKLAPRSLRIGKTSLEPVKVTRALREYYFPHHEITERDWINLTTLYSDSWFTIGILDGAYRHSGDVYFYYFDYVGEKSPEGAANRNNSIIFGASHVEEMVYLWHYKHIGALTGKDLEISKRLVKAWTDFAKQGNPAPIGSGLQWDKWTPEKRRYLNINKNGYHMEEDLAHNRYKFWKTLNYFDRFNLLK